MNRYSRLIIVLILLMYPGKAAMADSLLFAMVPATINGWTTSEDRSFDRETLFDYINGGAELYLSYSFTRLASRTYVRDNQPDIMVDVFDMTTSRNAYGVFSHAREIEETTFGQGSQYTEGLLLFWKGRYFVSILTSPETPEARQAVFRMAKHIDNAITDTGPLPEVLELLPQPGLIAESVRYFFHYIWLNSHYYIADENILHIEENCEALLAAYKREGGRAFLLVVRYEGEREAGEAQKSFLLHYLPDSDYEAPVRIEDGSWAGCRRQGDLLVAVFNAGNSEQAAGLMAAVLELNNRK